MGKQRNPAIAVSALMREGDAALLIKRKYAPGAGKWSLPGGTLEYGETTEACAIREISEEIGLDIKIEKLHGIYNVIGNEKGYGGYHFVIVCYKARKTGGKLGLSDEVANVAWISKKWLKNFNLTSSTVEALCDAGF